MSYGTLRIRLRRQITWVTNRLRRNHAFCAPSTFWCALHFAVLSSGAICSNVHGDVWVLDSGGRISGTLINTDRLGNEPFEVQLESGGVISIAPRRVQEFIRQNPNELEYEKVAPTFADTVEGQWEAAEWCRERSLKRLREHHLRRVIELRPDHAKAWGALGYTQVKGEWKRRNEVAEENGFRFHMGRWRLEQEIQLIEERQRTTAMQIEWRQRITKWHEATRVRDRTTAEAHRELAAIRDPLAVPALVQTLVTERRPVYRLFFVDLLDKIDSPAAHNAVLRTTLLELHPEVAHGAIDRVIRRRLPSDVDFYCNALNQRNNVIINRAAIILGKMADYSSLVPLMNALYTPHELVMGPDAHIVPGRPIIMSTDPILMSAAHQGRFNLSDDDDLPQIQPVLVRNIEVQAALLKISGVDFGYDVPAWKKWYANWNIQRLPQLEARRMP